jgi:hypothetical protein
MDEYESYYNSVSARSDFGCDLIEVKLHSFGVAGRQHEGGAGSAFGPHRTGRSIGSFDRGRHGGVNPSWPRTRPLPVCRVRAAHGFPPHARRSFFERVWANRRTSPAVPGPRLTSRRFHGPGISSQGKHPGSGGDGRPGDRVAIRPALWLACFLSVRDLSGRLLRILQMMLRR